MANKDRDLSDPYVKWYYKHQKELSIRRTVFGVALLVVTIGSALYALYTEYNDLLFLIVCGITAVLFIWITIVPLVLGFIEDFKDGSGWRDVKYICAFVAAALVLFGIASAAKEAGYSDGYYSAIGSLQENYYEEWHNEGYEEGREEGWKQGYNACMYDYDIE
jgi:hypothetical protein